jgi:hypothetical protein
VTGGPCTALRLLPVLPRGVKSVQFVTRELETMHHPLSSKVDKESGPSRSERSRTSEPVAAAVTRRDDERSESTSRDGFPGRGSRARTASAGVPVARFFCAVGWSAGAARDGSGESTAVLTDL